MLIVLNSNLTTVEVITGVILDSYMPTAKWFVGQLPTICCISLILQLCFTPKLWYIVHHILRYIVEDFI